MPRLSAPLSISIAAAVPQASRFRHGRHPAAVTCQDRRSAAAVATPVPARMVGRSPARRRDSCGRDCQQLRGSEHVNRIGEQFHPRLRCFAGAVFHAIPARFVSVNCCSMELSPSLHAPSCQQIRVRISWAGERERSCFPRHEAAAESTDFAGRADFDARQHNRHKRTPCTPVDGTNGRPRATSSRDVRTSQTGGGRVGSNL